MCRQIKESLYLDKWGLKILCNTLQSLHLDNNLRLKCFSAWSDGKHWAQGSRPFSYWEPVWTNGRSMHHSGVYSGRNCSLPLYYPFVCRPSRDSIRQPSDWEAAWFTDRILPTDCLLLTAVTSRQCQACLLQLCQKFITKWALLLIFSFSQTGKGSLCVCTSTCRQCRVKCFGVSSPPPPHSTHSHQICLAFWLLSSGSLSYSWAICSGKCRVRCLSNRTSSVLTVHLLTVSSSAQWHRGDPRSKFQVQNILKSQLNLIVKVRASGSSMLKRQVQISSCTIGIISKLKKKCVTYLT